MTARAGQDRCVCGEAHSGDDETVTPATAARVKAYLGANPDHQFVDDETGIIAVIVIPRPGTSGPLRILAQSSDLAELLDAVGADGA